MSSTNINVEDSAPHNHEDDVEEERQAMEHAMEQGEAREYQEITNDYSNNW